MAAFYQFVYGRKVRPYRREPKGGLSKSQKIRSSRKAEQASSVRQNQRGLSHGVPIDAALERLANTQESLQ